MDTKYRWTKPVLHRYCFWLNQLYSYRIISVGLPIAIQVEITELGGLFLLLFLHHLCVHVLLSKCSVQKAYSFEVFADRGSKFLFTFFC